MKNVLFAIAAITLLAGCDAAKKHEGRKTAESLQKTDDFPACATAAAQEFSVPVKLLKAMALAEVDGCDQECKKKHESHGESGPMGLGNYAIPEMAEGLGVSDVLVKEDACTNYRAAAWWFANKSGGKQLEMWEAVTNFYYGTPTPTPTNNPATERVKKIYAEL